MAACRVCYQQTSRSDNVLLPVLVQQPAGYAQIQGCYVCPRGERPGKPDSLWPRRILRGWNGKTHLYNRSVTHFALLPSLRWPLSSFLAHFFSGLAKMFQIFMSLFMGMAALPRGQFCSGLGTISSYELTFFFSPASGRPDKQGPGWRIK